MSKLQAVVEDNPAEAKSVRTRKRILQAAASVFREQGYASSSLREIADRAGMQAGSLYYHFNNKEALAEAVMDEGVYSAQHAAESAIKTLEPDADPLDQIEAAFRGHLHYLLEASDFAVATLRMLQQTPEAIRDRHMKKQRAFGQFYARLFRQAQEGGFIRADFHLSALRMLLLGALNWSPEWYSQSGLSPDELVNQLSAMMKHGVMPESAAAKT